MRMNLSAVNGREAYEVDMLLAMCALTGLTIAHVDTTEPYPDCVLDVVAPEKLEPPRRHTDRDKPWRRWPVRR